MSVLDVQNKQVDIPLTGGLLTDIPTSNVPPGLSPNCQDCDFLPRAVTTRSGIGTSIFPAIAGNPSINYLKSYEQVSLAKVLLSLDSNGALWSASSLAGGLAQIGSVVPGSRGKSATGFGREFIALGDGRFGLDIPRGYDGQYFDRVSQVGPGAPPAVADSVTAGSITAGVHQLVVMFVTETNYITKPSPPVSWTAAGLKKSAVTAIPTGPPNVIARILAFTTATGAAWFYLSSFIINDNSTTTLTVDFTDPGLLAGSPVALLFNNVELGEVSGFAVYASRLFTWGERNKIQNFLNLTFDGGFGTAPVGSSAGPNSPSAATSSGPGFAWANPANVFALDGAYASFASSAFGTSALLEAKGYAFAIPATATISGIVATVYAYNPTGSTNFIGDWTVRLLDKTGAPTGSNHVGNVQFDPYTVGPIVYGGPTDLWGAAWTPTDINSANFGLLFQATATQAGLIGDVDYISIKVYYTAAAAGAAPLGWTQGATFAGGNSALLASQRAYWGDAYSIVGDGATAKRGLITQSAYQDYLTVPILGPNVSYRVRARLARNNTLVAGTLHINLQSTTGAFTTMGMAIPAAALTTTYVEVQSFLTDAPLQSLPADLLLQIYADGTPTNGGIFLVDCVEIYPANKPYVAGIRGSSVDDPETFDGVNGLLQVPTPEPVRAMFVLADRSQLVTNDHLYAVTDNTMYRTQDNGGNPATWTWAVVSGVVGTPSVDGVDVGEDWAAIAHPSGLYLYYFGSEPTKISQEVQSLAAASPDGVSWDSINWQNGFQVWVRVDVQGKRVLVGAPTGGAAAPNQIMMMNYRGLVDSSQIITTPPMHPSYTGKFIAMAIGRKWSPWTIAANCCWIEPKDSPLAVPAAGAGAIFLGNSAGNGKIYNLTPANGFLDDGVNIPSFYDTAFVPSDEQKEQFGMLGSLVYLSYLRAHAQGSGNVQFTFFGPDYATSTIAPRAADPGVPNVKPAVPAAPAIALSSPAKRDIETQANMIAERLNVRIQALGAAGTGPWFSAQKLELFLQPNPTGAIYGFN